MINDVDLSGDYSFSPQAVITCDVANNCLDRRIDNIKRTR